MTNVFFSFLGFIEYVVCPLFGAWHQWLGTSLSSTMMGNLKSNLIRWQETLKGDNIVTQKSLLLGENKQTSVERQDTDNDSNSSGSSSSENADSVSHTMNAPQTIVGRRHSLPLNVPSMLPRTVIRRESLSKDGQHPIVLETVQMEGMSLSAVSQTETDPAGSKTQSGHISILTNMDGSSMPSRGPQRKSQSKSEKRRMSLPGLLSHNPQHRFKQPVSTLQPLPATPSLEELRLPDISKPQDTNQSSHEIDNSQPSSTSQGTSSRDANTRVSSCVVPPCDDRISDRHDTGNIDQTASRMDSNCEATDNSMQTLDNPSDITASQSQPPFSALNVNIPISSNPISYSESQNIKSEIIAHHNKRMCSEPSRCSRRASLDSSACVNVNLNENLNLQNLRNSNFNLDSSNSNLRNSNTNLHLGNLNMVESAGSNSNKWVTKRALGDKENREPCKGRTSLLARTRNWRSLNYEDDAPRNPSQCARISHQQVTCMIIL